MRILVLGGDGYLGWPTALHLSDRGHHVAVADSFVRRRYDHELGVWSLVPIEPLSARDPRLATRFDYDAIFGTVLPPPRASSGCSTR
jgi:nucleoside-diphosphate-sugar epimerase